MTVGRVVSHFEILAHLGEGGMGVVYEARDIRLDRPVALKFLPRTLGSNLVARGRFLQEAKAASALDHPNICTIYEIGESDDGEIFIAMARYGGQTLKELIEGGPLPPERAVNIARQIVEGLSAAHGAGIVHRDIKPANVMVAEDGLVHILDFGLAKVAEQHLTATGSTVGTVAYMSPEQARGEPVDQTTDLWSLGCVLYEMLAGVSPFHAGHESAIVYRLLNEDPEPLGDRIPTEYGALGPLVERCLQKERGARYGSASEIRSDLEALENSVAAEAALATEFASSNGAGTQLRSLLIGFVAVVIFVVIGFGIVGRGEPESELPAGIAVLPFRSVDADPLDCFGLGELLTIPLYTAASQAGLTVVRQGELAKEGISTAGGAYEALDTQLAFSGTCYTTPGRIELDLTIEDAVNGARVVRQKHMSFPQSDLRELQLDGPAVISELIPGLGGAAVMLGGTNVAAAVGHFARGTGALMGGDRESEVDLAIAELENAVMLDPEYGLGLSSLGDAYLIKHQFHGNDPRWVETAVDVLSRALDVEPQLTEARLTMVRAHMALGELHAAQRQIALARSVDSTDWNVHRTGAELSAALGDQDAAEASYRLAIEKMPGYLRLRLLFGNFLVNHGRVAEARLEFEEIRVLAPDSYLGLNAMGAVLYYQDSLATAVDYFERAVAAKPTYPGLANLMTMQWDLRRFETAAAGYRRIVTDYDSARRDHRMWGNLGLMETGAGRADSARVAFEEAIVLAEEELTRQPGSAVVQMDLATYLAHTGQMDRALEITQRSLQFSETEGSSLQSAAVVYELAGDRKSALFWIGRAIEIGHRVSMIESDPDLDELREDPNYAAFFDDDDEPGRLPAASNQP